MRILILPAIGSALLVAAIAGAGASQESPPRPLLPPLPKDDLGAFDVSGARRVGLPEAIPGVESTPLALARVALGRKLFFDPILSADRTVSCASCHEPDHGFASREAKPLGIGGRRAARNAPPVFNRAFGTAQFWDGRAATIEEQVLVPIENPDEMGLPLEKAVARLAADEEYKALFEAAGGKPGRDLLARSVAEFLRRLVVGDSPIDHFRAAKTELTPLERRGLWLFESKGRCWRCHSGPNFSDEAFHDTGVGATAAGEPEPGRFAITHERADRGRFKTPTLRMVAHTAPYMHDGSLATLEEVIRYYSRGANPNDNLDPLIQRVDFSDEEVAALVALLEALSRVE